MYILLVIIVVVVVVCISANKWLQQQIPACRPVFTAKYVFVLFIAIGALFLALGITFVAVTVGVSLAHCHNVY